MADFLVLETARARGLVKLAAGRVISDTEFDVTALAAQGVALLAYVPATMDAVVEAFQRQRGKPEPEDGDLTALLIGAGIIGGGAVDSVFGRTGIVVAAASDYDASQVDNDSGVAGATVAAALDTLAAASTSQLFRHDVNDATFPATDPAGAGSRNAHPIASFDDTTAEALIFNGLMSNNYAEGDFNVDIDWVAASATTGGVTWGVSVERLAPGGQDIDVDGFAAQQTGTSTTNATSGVITRTTITLTQAQADSIAAGDRYRIEIERVTGDGGDTMVGDAQIVGVAGRQ